MSDPTTRFSGRVEDYVRYRPHYPPAVVRALEEGCGLSSDSVVADVGSGTGILSQTVLELGSRVFGVEPNREMREAGERMLARFPRFTSVDGRAEETTLPDASVDFVMAGQAFHWFDRERSHAEFARILRPGGWVTLVWNKRRKTGTPLVVAYERLLLEHALDYTAVDHDRITDGMIAEFFGPAAVQVRSFENHQVLDYAALEGYLRSASYVPAPGHPSHATMVQALRVIFDELEVGGSVVLEHDTLLYFGQL